jgi:hypothetical protein
MDLWWWRKATVPASWFSGPGSNNIMAASKLPACRRKPAGTGGSGAPINCGVQPVVAAFTFHCYEDDLAITSAFVNRPALRSSQTVGAGPIISFNNLGSLVVAKKNLYAFVYTIR